MPAIIPVNLDVRSAEVLDGRTAGLSTDTNSLSFKAAGLLRYETDLDSWKYYNGSNFVPLTSDAYTEIEQNGAGNIGIGTASPIAKLQVKGNIFTEDTAGNNHVRLDDDGSIQCIAIIAQTFENSNFALSEYGEILAGGSSQDSGTDGSVLISKGTGNPVEWRPRVIATAYLTSNVGYPTLVRAAMTDMKPLTVEMDLGTSGSYGYTTSTGIYTIPYDGVYRVVYQVGFLDNDGYGPHGMNACSLELLKNTGGGFTREYNSTSKSSNEYEDNRLMANLIVVLDISQGEQLLCRASYFSGNSNTVMVGGNSPRYCFQSIELIG
jgi:hypothetical protein